MNNIDVKSICQNELLCNTYIVGDELNCIVIDPSADIESIKKLIDKRVLRGIILTHGHYDHFVTLKPLFDKYHPKVYMHKKALLKIEHEQFSLSYLFSNNYIIRKEELDIEKVNEGSIIDFSTFQAKILYTPGHTDCSISIIIDKALFSGDTLFNHGVGRWDLPSGSKEQLKLSINKLLNLDYDYLLYPGHGTSSTIKQEKNDKYYQRFLNR